MAMNPNHRYAILDASRGSRLIETETDETYAIIRANTLTHRMRVPIEVKDRERKDHRGKSTVIYATLGIAAGESTQVTG